MGGAICQERRHGSICCGNGNGGLRRLTKLDLAERYAKSLNGKRMRFGTVLPAMIGRKTLDRLELASWENWESGVKISRKEVYCMMAKAARFAVS